MNYVYPLFMLMFFLNCQGQNRNGATGDGPDANRPPVFRMPQIPSVLTSPGERAGYLLMHYWDNFDFRDTAFLHLPEVTEQAFVDYLDVMPYAPDSVAAASVKSMLKKAEADAKMYLYFTGLYEKYLYDPNSPMRNDEWYIPVLESMLQSPLVEEKIRPGHLLKLAKQNRPGAKAADFIYTTAGGRKASLYSLKTDYTLLFFYNPDCRNCREVSALLQASLVIQSLLKDGRLGILAVYPEEDLQAWRNYLAHLPEEWINAYDAGGRLQDEEVYDLKAIPTLYLLDKEKTVLLKDPAFERLENYLRQ